MSLRKIRDAVEAFQTKVYPAPVAPFVTMVAEALANQAKDFEVAVDPFARLLTISVRENPSREFDLDMAVHGVGIRMDYVQRKITIITHYFDDVPLNWRETQLIRRAVDQFFDSFSKAQIQAMFAAAIDAETLRANSITADKVAVGVFVP
jgi:hypothetical protein